MSSPKGKSYDEVSRAKDNIQRGIKEPNYIGTACFVGSRALDPFLQYGILANGYGSNLIQKLGGEVLPQGPALFTNTPLDSLLGLSPYRSIIFGMSMGSMIKQNIHCAAMMNEQISPAFVLRWQSTDEWVISTGVTNFSGAARGTKFIEKVDVRLVIVSPLVWHIIFVVDGFNGADWFAGAAVNTFIRVNV